MSIEFPQLAKESRDPVTPEAVALFETWKKGPVILASGSAYKLEGLRALGMEHVEATAVPEEVETEVFERFDNNKGYLGEEAASLLAKAKVAASA